jgi:hypothetical protein
MPAWRGVEPFIDHWENRTMHTRFALVIAAVATPFVLLLIGPGRCADSSAGPPPPTVEKRLAELESKVADLTKEVETLRHEDVIEVFPLDYHLRMSAKEVAEAVKVLFKSAVGVEVVPLPETGALMLRGDKKAVDNITSFFNQILPLGKAKQPPSPADEKRLRELESKLSAFAKEMDALHRDDAFQVIETNSISAEDAANAVRAFFREPLAIQVTALPGPNILVLRGDKEIVEKIAEFVKAIEPLGEAKQKVMHEVGQKKPNE